MKRTILAAGLALAISGPAFAASEWGIEGEAKTRAEVKVVDLLCEVTGQCAENCGDGRRQLGLLFDDGRLVPVLKNFDIFAGGTDDLLKYCGQKITADGLMITNEKMNMFAIQFTKPGGDGKWGRSNQWGKNWSARNGGKKANQWFRTDKLVLDLIAEEGVFGIPGLEPEE